MSDDESLEVTITADTDGFVIAAQDATIALLELELSRLRAERDAALTAHNDACRLLWLVYAAAMSESFDTFQGVPGDGVAQAVEARIEALNDELAAAVAENERLKTAAAEHAMNENYNEAGQAILRDIADERRALQVELVAAVARAEKAEAENKRARIMLANLAELAAVGEHPA